MVAYDHHTAWANTIALEKAGVLNGRDVGVGNEIVMGDDGLATGELRETKAMQPVMALRTDGGREGYGMKGTEPQPGPSSAERRDDREILEAGLRYCAELGITSIHNMDGNLYQLELLDEIRRAGELRCRTQIPYHLTNVMPITNLEQASEMHRRFSSPMLHSGRVKMFMDGVLESWTAVMLEDYADRPGHRGDPLFSAEHFSEAAIEADRRGLQISVHAIGDGAVHRVLNGYEAAQRANGRRDSRHRIEHVEVIHPGDIARLVDLGVVASMQPPHSPGTMGLPLEPTVSRIGEACWPYSYAWRSLWDAGAQIAFSSDWPVSPLAPMKTIQAAVTREPWNEQLADQRATLYEALAACTKVGAYANFTEDSIGRLETGMLADVVVLSDDIEETAPGELGEVRPVVTICDGQITYEA